LTTRRDAPQHAEPVADVEARGVNDGDVGVVGSAEFRDSRRRGNRTAPAFVAGYFRRVPLAACLSVAPAENFGALDALILTGAPVCGSRPVRAPRFVTENFPKPVIATSSPFLSVSCTVL
jgi:hypothetical protein